jgi:hypothetical protein
MAFFILNRLIGAKAALFSMTYLSVSPFFLGHSRLINDEAIMAAAILLSIFSLVLYRRSKNKAYFALSALVGGFAILTKSTGIFLTPVIGLILLEPMALDAWQKRRFPAFSELSRNVVFPLLIWLLVVVAFYVLAWPGMWVQPGSMLTNVYGNAFSYAFSGSRLQVQESIPQGWPALKFVGIAEYLWGLILQTHLFTWIGSGLAWVLLFRPTPKQKSEDFPGKRITVFLTIQAVIFVIVLGMVGGRDSAHYILTSHVSIEVVAALGFVMAGRFLVENYARVSSRLISMIAVCLIIAQLVAALLQFPYYYTYTNGVLRSFFGLQAYKTGYGEGLEHAGEYLSQKPNAEDLTVMSWYSYAFSFFFPGHTEQILIAEEWAPAHIDRLAESDYLVVYYTHQKNRNMPAKLLAELDGVPIEHSIWLNGFEAVRIYDVSILPASLYTPSGAAP